MALGIFFEREGLEFLVDKPLKWEILHANKLNNLNSRFLALNVYGISFFVFFILYNVGILWMIFERKINKGN